MEERHSSDAVGYGMAREPEAIMNQDQLWAAMLWTVCNPQEFGLKVDRVSVHNRDGCVLRTMRRHRPEALQSIGHRRLVVQDGEEMHVTPLPAVRWSRQPSRDPRAVPTGGACSPL